MKATIENLNSVKFEVIIITDKDGKYKDTFSKDLTNNYAPFCTLGTDEYYEAEDLHKRGWVLETDNIINGDELVISDQQEKKTNYFIKYDEISIKCTWYNLETAGSFTIQELKEFIKGKRIIKIQVI